VITSRYHCRIIFFFFSSRRRHTRCYRDWIQTCALPISAPSAIVLRSRHSFLRRPTQQSNRALQCDPDEPASNRRETCHCQQPWRSEERRVGKEGGYRG